MGFAAGNAQHIGSRQQQQDAFGFSDPSEQTFVVHGGFLGIVADGVGGLTHGSEASQAAVRAFLQAYHLKSAGEPIPAALLRSIREANAAVLRVASEPSAEGAGTTIAAAVLHDHAMHWISAGDSRIYLLRGDRLTRITSDHTYARQLDEQAAQGKISLSEAQSHSERGSLTSYLGQAEPKEVDRSTRALALQPDDVVVVCSDGFYRALDEAEILAAFRSGLQRGCDDLVRQVLAKQRKGQDNLTVIALKQSGRTRKVRGSGEKLNRLRAYAVLVLGLALISAAVGFWYEKRSGNAPQGKPQLSPTPAVKPNAAAVGTVGDPNQGKISLPNMTPPPPPPLPPSAQPKAPAKQSKKNKRNSRQGKNSLNKTSPTTRGDTTTAVPETAPETAPAPVQDATEGGSNSPDRQSTQTDVPASQTEEKTSPKTPAPGDAPPPTPPTIDNDKPNGPLHLASANEAEELHVRDPFKFSQGRALSQRKGSDLCHS